MVAGYRAADGRRKLLVVERIALDLTDKINLRKDLSELHNSGSAAEEKQSTMPEFSGKENLSA
jgi:hypothetical protein